MDQDPHPPVVPLPGLGQVLRRQEAALEDLHHRATVLRLLIDAGVADGISTAIDDLEHATAEVGDLELLRSVLCGPDVDAEQVLAGLPDQERVHLSGCVERIRGLVAAIAAVTGAGEPAILTI